MENNNKKMSLLNLTAPILIENLLFMLLGIVDVYVLSGYNDSAAAAVNTANQIVSVCNLVFTVTANASAVLIAQNLGAGNRQKASKIAALSISMNSALGIVISVIFIAFGKALLEWIGADGEVLEFASEYLTIVGGFMFGQAVLNAVLVAFRNHGYTKIAMYITLAMNIINTVLDISIVPILGVKGAAIATTVSRFIGVAAALVLFFIKLEKPSVFKMLKPFPLKDVVEMLKIGVPSAFETANYNISQLVVTAIALNFLTDNEYIAKSYLQNITTLFYIFSLSIGQASQIITSYKMGQKDFDGAYRGGLRALGFGLSVSMAVSVIGICFRERLFSFFTENPEVIALGSTAITINLFLELGRSTNLVLISSLRGAKDVYFPTAAAIFSTWVICALGAYILTVVFEMGLVGMCIAFAADECFRGIMMVYRWAANRRTIFRPNDSTADYDSSVEN